MFSIIEMQTNNGLTIIVTPRTISDINEAESAYYLALSAAAVSSVQIHAVTLLDEHGYVLKRDCYERVE